MHQSFLKKTFTLKKIIHKRDPDALKNMLSQMEKEEQVLYKEMNQQFKKVLYSLNDFQDDRLELQGLIDSNEGELIKSSRLIKYEVLEMADSIEALQQN